MPIRAVLPVTLGLSLAVACGGSVSVEGGSNPGGSGGSVLTGGSGGTGGTGGIHFGGSGGTGGIKTGGTGGIGGTGGYIDPGCPDAAPPPPIEECDVFGPNSCPPGEGCYPFVQYPSGPCDQEVFGSVCAPVGSGKQGDICGADNCAAGFVCVITGQGTECVQICQLTGPNTCPKGLFCVPIDVEGVGGCY